MNFQTIAGGFGLLESPRADARNLWFSDMALGGVHRLGSDGHIDHWLSDRRMIGGIAVNEDGVLLCSGTGGIVWIDPVSGTTGTLLQAVEGQPISGVNDMLADPCGGLLFGTVDHARMFRGENFFGNSALYRLAPDGSVRRLCEGIHFANGIGLSPDARTIYLNNSGIGTFAYQWLRDGTLGAGRQISDRADCDGLAVDCEGAVWIARISAHTILRLMPDGRVDQEIEIPCGAVTSLCFGGPDGCDLYVTTAAPGAGEAVVKGAVPNERSAAVLRGRALVRGVPMARTRFHLRDAADT